MGEGGGGWARVLGGWARLMMGGRGWWWVSEGDGGLVRVVVGQ